MAKFFRSAFLLIPVVVAPAAFAQGMPEKPAPRTPRVIRMTAKNFDFDPSEIRVKVGEKIQLKVTAVDRTHGLHINPFPDGGSPNTPPGLSFTYGDDCLKLKKDLTGILEFVAEAPGTYVFTCCKKCGTGHGRMKGKLIVEP